MSEPVALAVADNVTPEDLHEGLLRDHGCDAGPRGRIERTYVDTFDWRFAAAGLVVEYEKVVATGGGDQPADPGYLRLRRRGALAPLQEAPLAVIPRLVRQVPDERLRDLLSQVAGNRALLVVGRLTSEIGIYRVIDLEGKATVRVLVEALTPVLVGPAGSATTARRLVLTPVRGHTEEFTATRARVEAWLGAQPAPEPADLAALAAGYDPGLDPSRIDLTLDPGLSAPAAVRAVLGRYLQVVAANEAGARDDLDVEFLDDFRVAVRRIRSLLSAAEGVLPEAERDALAVEFRWLGAVTTPVRDFDVLLEDLEEASATVPAWHEHLGPFRAVVEQWRAATRSELVAALGSDRYRAALAAGQNLAAPVPDEHPVTPAVIFAGRRIGKAAKRLRRLGRAAETAPDWHEVRKAAKRLRYLIDGFGTLFPPETVEPALRELKRLQSTLGELQDRAAHGELTARVARALATQPAVSVNPPVTALALVAAGAVAQSHAERETSAYRACASSFARYDRKKVRVLLRELSWDTSGEVRVDGVSAVASDAAGDIGGDDEVVIHPGSGEALVPAAPCDDR
jgi:CHAD domain-containing protein